jgi:hypothetical protein
MAYNFGGPRHLDQTLDHVPEFKKRLDGAVANAKSVVYIGWRPNDSEYKFFEWLSNVNIECPPLTLVVEAWGPNVEAFNPPYDNCFKVHGRAEMLFDLVPPWMRDCVIWQDGPEHMFNGESERLVKSWQLLGFKSIVLSTPDGWLDQGAINGNELERHLGAWTKAIYKSLNFKVESYSAGLIGFWCKEF